MAGRDGGQDTPKPKIIFGDEVTSSPKEILKNNDHLNVNPSWLAGVKQYDGYSCAFFVMTALDRMQKDSTLVGTNLTNEQVQANLVGISGLDRLREYTQGNREDQLSFSEFQDRLVDFSTPEAEVFISRADFDFANENMTAGQIALEATKLGYGVGVEIRNQGHLVFAIGSSDDGKELICWDPLMGEPDVNHPATMLRRLPANSPQLAMWGGLKLSDKYKVPKISGVPTSFEEPEVLEAPQVEFGQYQSQRRGFWDRVRNFINSL